MFYGFLWTTLSTLITSVHLWLYRNKFTDFCRFLQLVRDTVAKSMGAEASSFTNSDTRDQMLEADLRLNNDSNTILEIDSSQQRQYVKTFSVAVSSQLSQYHSADKTRREVSLASCRIKMPSHSFRHILHALVRTLPTRLQSFALF